MPLALLGGVAIKVSTARIVAKVTEVQVRTADVLSDHVADWLDLQLQLIARQVSTLDYLATGQIPERSAFLRLVYSQNPAVQIAALVDSKGADMAPPMALKVAGTGALAGRDAIDAARLERFYADVAKVRRQTPPGRVGFGEPVVPAGRKAPVVVLVARLVGGATLGAELSLSPLVSRFSVPPESEEDLALLDSAQQLVLGDGSLVDAEALTALPEGLLEDVRYTLADGTKVLAASAPVAGTGWHVLVSEPLDSTSASARDIVEQTAYVMGVAALTSIILGLLVSRQITGPVLDLSKAALAVAEGHAGLRVESRPGGGELTELTHAFNFMSRRLDQNRLEIAAQRDEIEAFNRELQARVEQRTQQLRQAQDRLVRTARLAAVGEMGAGLAHELNNPLAGILGLTQVLVERASTKGEAGMLRSIEEQTQRCSEIVSRMQAFSRLDTGAPALDQKGWAVVDIGAVIEEVLGLMQGSFADRGVTLAWQLASGLRVRGDRGALGQAFTQLLTSLRSAAAPGSHLNVKGITQDRDVVIEFRLGGAPLRVGDDDWMASGMGFWTARQVLAAHGGQLDEPVFQPKIAPTDGRWAVRLPVA
ncbi:MAG: HAMP domain-containing protein [Oligoflexia bacterium]|nr:HAMP domain-containing protein [Oligoflexia bacterium]